MRLLPKRARAHWSQLVEKYSYRAFKAFVKNECITNYALGTIRGTSSTTTMNTSFTKNAVIDCFSKREHYNGARTWHKCYWKWFSVISAVNISALAATLKTSKLGVRF